MGGLEAADGREEDGVFGFVEKKVRQFGSGGGRRNRRVQELVRGAEKTSGCRSSGGGNGCGCHLVGGC